MYGLMLSLSRLMALLGGLCLSAVIIMVCLSILGREASAVLNGDVMQSIAPGLANGLLALGIGPVTGDFELVEAGVAFAIFAFLPWCQITGGHAAVDLFTTRLSPGWDRVLRAVTDGVFAAVIILIAVQLYQGMLSKQSSGQTTFLLQFPVWWAYGASLLGAVTAALVSVYVASMRLAELALGRSLLPLEAGAEH